MRLQASSCWFLALALWVGAAPCQAVAGECGEDTHERTSLSADAREVFPILKHGKIGFMDQMGNVVLEPTFSMTEEPIASNYCEPDLGRMVSQHCICNAHSIYHHFPCFVKRVAVVARGELFGFVRQNGTMLFEPQFQRVTGFYGGVAWGTKEGQDFLLSDSGRVLAGPFQDHGRCRTGICPVKMSEKWGVIDLGGKVRIAGKYDAIGDMGFGLIVVCEGDTWGVVDWTGKSIIAPAYQKIELTSLGTLAVQRNERWGIIDVQGNTLTPMEYEYISPWYAEGLTDFAQGGKRGYIDGDGNVVIPPQFDSAGDFCEGRAWVGIGGKFGYIDQKGKVVIAPQYDDMHSFHDGCAMVAIEIPQIGKRWGLIDRFGRTLIEPRPEVVTRGFDSGELGYIGCKADGSEPESGGGGSSKSVTLHSIANCRGDALWTPRVSPISRLGECRAIVEDDQGGKQLVGLSGEVFSPQDLKLTSISREESEGLRVIGTGTLRVQATKPGLIGLRFGYMDVSGKVVIAPQFDDAMDFDRGLARVNIGGTWELDQTFHGGKWGYINRRGEWVWKPTQ